MNYSEADSCSVNRPRNSFFFGGSKHLLPGARPGSKTNFVVVKFYVHFCMQ